MKKKSGLSSEKKVQRILVSGSAVLPQKNVKGIRVARKRKAQPQFPNLKGYPDLSDIPSDNYGNLTEAGSINPEEFDGGIVSGKLVRTKYDNTELKKSIDTDIFELIPREEVELPDTVLRSVYNEVTQSVNDLTIEVAELTFEISTLNSKISELEIVSESLKIEADNERLKANIAEQQATTANEQVSETTIDLSNAIQNSINEAIQRVSLTARSEALYQENVNLREQLFGLSAVAAGGGVAGGSNNFAVTVIGSEVSTADIKDTISDERIDEGNNWQQECKISIEIDNVSTELKITTVNFNKVSGDSIFEARNEINGLTIDSESSGIFKLRFPGGIKDAKPRNWTHKAKNYNGNYEVVVKFDDGSTDSVQLTAALRKNKKK